MGELATGRNYRCLANQIARVMGRKARLKTANVRLFSCYNSKTVTEVVKKYQKVNQKFCQVATMTGTISIANAFLLSF